MRRELQRKREKLKSKLRDGMAYKNAGHQRIARYGRLNNNATIASGETAKLSG